MTLAEARKLIEASEGRGVAVQRRGCPACGYGAEAGVLVSADSRYAYVRYTVAAQAIRAEELTTLAAREPAGTGTAT